MSFKRSREDLLRLVPQEVLDFKYEKPVRKKKTKETNEVDEEAEYLKLARKSSFILTINPQQSMATLSTVEQRNEASIKLLDFNDQVEDHLRNGRFMKQRPCDEKKGCVYETPQLEIYEPKLEVGGKQKRLHSHALVQLSGTAFLDVDAIRARGKEVYGKNIHVSAKWTQTNSKEVMDAYMNKGQGIGPAKAKEQVHSPDKPKQPPTIQELGAQIPEGTIGFG